MNTMIRNTSARPQSALAPSPLTTGGAGGIRPPVGSATVHKGIWIGGGLMALTIVALATALIVKGNSGAEAPVAAVATPAATVPVPAVDPATVAPPPVVVAQTPPVIAAPPAARPAPARTVHHAPARTTQSNTGTGYGSGNSGSNDTQVASVGSGTGNNSSSNSNVEPARPAPPPVCTTCGVIDSFDTVQVAGQANGVGAVAGGVGGAVIGSQIAGRHNHTLGGVLGAVGGGLLGNEIEKRQRTTNAYDVHVRMNDGSIRTVRQTTAPVVGSRVNVQGNSITSAPSQSNYDNGGSSSYSQPSYSSQGGSGNGGSSFSPSGN